MTAALLLSVLLSGLLPGTGPAQTSSAPADQWLSYDAATNTVTFELIAGPFTFNGYRDGGATLLVPSKAKIVMNFVNKDGTPHSAIVISGDGPIPNSPSDPAIPRAYTNKVLEGLPQEATGRDAFPRAGERHLSDCMRGAWPRPFRNVDLAQGGPGREAAYLRAYKGLKATLEQGGGHIDGEFRLVGDLTIRGVTREMVLHVSAEGRLTDPWGAERAGFSAHGKIDRTDFGLT